MRYRRTIVPRRPIFLGCERKSEQGYGALLNRLVHDIHGLHIHIRVEPLQPGAGDPSVLMRRAVQKIADIERRGTRFSCKAILLDRGEPQKVLDAQRLAAASRIDHVIWQEPDHEAFVLRHLDGCQHLRPPAGETLRALRQRWPRYEKGSTQLQLSEHIDLSCVERACGVEPELQAFLLAIGFIRHP